MKLQKASRFALYAVLELASRPEGYFTAADLGDTFGISVNHLGKVMRTLVRAGLVQSVRGSKGGFQFSGNARRTTLMDVIELFETVGGPEGGALEPGGHTDIGGALGEVLDEIDQIAQATLRSITIATMLKLVARQRSGRDGAGTG
jgi:Rrf2 family protein